MSCKKVKEKLTAYLAGECRPSEQKSLEEHLNTCPDCQVELEELKQIDLLLNLWLQESSPPDLKDGVLAALKKDTILDSEPVSVFRRFFRPLVLRDLVAAAAVSLAIFWAGASWTATSSFNQAGKNINYATTAYSKAVGDKFELATTFVQKYSSKILIEEWKQSEMYKSSGY